MIRFACPKCQQGFQAEDTAAGKRTKCPKCGAAVSVPVSHGFSPATPVPPPSADANPAHSSPPKVKAGYGLTIPLSQPPSDRLRDDRLNAGSLESSSGSIGISTREAPPRTRLIFVGIGGVLFLGITIGVVLWAAGSLSRSQNERSLQAEKHGNKSPTEPSTRASVTPAETAAPSEEKTPRASAERPQLEPPPVFKAVAFDFQGMRVGDLLTKQFADSHCPAKDEGKPDISGREFIKIGGKEVFVSYQFADFKLISVSLLFESDLFADMIQAYTSKFGSPPHRARNEKLITRVGVEYTNVIAEWDTDSGVFQIMKYGSTVDKGYAILNSPQLLKYQERKRESEQKELKSKL